MTQFHQSNRTQLVQRLRDGETVLTMRIFRWSRSSQLVCRRVVEAEGWARLRLASKGCAGEQGAGGESATWPSRRQSSEPQTTLKHAASLRPERRQVERRLEGSLRALALFCSALSIGALL